MCDVLLHIVEWVNIQDVQSNINGIAWIESWIKVINQRQICRRFIGQLYEEMHWVIKKSRVILLQVTKRWLWSKVIVDLVSINQVSLKNKMQRMVFNENIYIKGCLALYLMQNIKQNARTLIDSINTPVGGRKVESTFFS